MIITNNTSQKDNNINSEDFPIKDEDDPDLIDNLLKENQKRNIILYNLLI